MLKSIIDKGAEDFLFYFTFYLLDKPVLRQLFITTVSGGERVPNEVGKIVLLAIIKDSLVWLKKHN